jgi:hypothetical protein
VWPPLKVSPALERFVAFLQASDVP